ncbi:MAG: quinol:cytochrome C oxidoreductase [Gemmatimonadetes bacterium]|nr:quinol:cytochrome C oxidoreductase [Gemmatimonadota bacterium]
MSVASRVRSALPPRFAEPAGGRPRVAQPHVRPPLWTVHRTLWALVALGGAGIVAAWFLAGAQRFWVNWLMWLVFMVCLALGALFLVALQHMTGARWSVPLRRTAERIAALTPWLVPVAAIALFSLPVVFSWTQPDAASITPLVLKEHWLNRPFFIIRLAVCLGLWVLSYVVLVRGSVRQDVTKDPSLTVRLRRFSPVFMILLALTITDFAFDWVSALEASWYSDIFGVYLFAGAVTTAIAATLLAVMHLQRRGRLPGVTGDHVYNLGGLLFGFTIFWAYIAFSQYLLQWYADLPAEVFWYVQRTSGPMGLVFVLLGVGHFFVPFLALMSRADKKSPTRLKWVAIWVIFMEFVDVFWLISPIQGGGIRLGWPEVSFAAFFVAAGLLVIRRALSLGEDMPTGDPFLAAGLDFHLR